MAVYIELTGQMPQKKRMLNFAYDIMDHFFTERLKRDVDIYISVSRTFDEGYLGFCDGNRDEVWIDLARSWEGTPLTAREIAQNLAHELVHAKQFIRGEINSTNYNYRRSGQKAVDYTDVSYRKRPWEVEAYGLEEPLTKLYW